MAGRASMSRPGPPLAQGLDPPLVPSTSPSHEHFALSLVSLRSRDQDGGPSNSVINIYDPTEK